MKLKLCASIFIAASIGAVAPVQAQNSLTVSEEILPQFAAAMASRDIVFEPMPSSGGNLGTEVINAVIVDRELFPTLFRMTTGGTCTAALVGPSAILTAAHCVAHEALIHFRTDNAGTVALCEQAAGYLNSGSESEDWAMCLLKHEITGVLYETIDIDNVPAVATKVYLTGYGCTEQGGGLDGELRIGPATVRKRPEVDWIPVEDSTIYTGAIPGDAVLCPGDSGGPLFNYFGQNYTDARSIVGVNSRTTYGYGVSLFAATGSRQGRLWLTYWAERHHVEVCGINREEGCY